MDCSTSEATPSDGLIVPAVLTDVPDDWEYGDYCPIVQTLHRGQLDFFDCVKDVLNRHGLHPFWNLLRLPWSRSAKCTVRLLAQILHYQTTERARGLKELHCAVARRSNGDLRETTWQCEEEAVGRKVFALMIQLDIFPFTFDFETSPTNELTKKALDFVMKKWDEKVLSVLYREDVTIALCSKATAIMWAKYRLGGNGRDIDTLVDSYESNPSKYVSASANEFLAPAHPSAILKPRFWSNMEVKCNDRDAFGTAILRLVTNDPSAECTYFRGIFEDNSSIFRLCQLVYLEGCRHGGDTMGKRRTDASARWNSDEDMSPEQWEALLACSRGGENSSGGETMGARRTEAKALYDAGLDMEEEHVEALLACSRGGDNLPPERNWARNSHQEMVDTIVRCTSASERLFLFELKTQWRLNEFVVANELDLARSNDVRFKRLKEIYQRQYADNDELTVALINEDMKLQKQAKEAKSKQRVRERAAEKERAAEVKKSKEERNARMRALFATGNDSPSLLRGREQPIEVVDRWLSSRKVGWRSSRRKRSLDTSGAANDETKSPKQAKMALKAGTEAIHRVGQMLTTFSVYQEQHKLQIITAIQCRENRACSKECLRKIVKDALETTGAMFDSGTFNWLLRKMVSVGILLKDKTIHSLSPLAVATASSEEDVTTITPPK
ncbi:hypothetical protein ACHAXT_003257 [Thalassiosira profunda]